MRLAGLFAIIGAALGATVAVIAHFLSWTLPHTFYIGTYQPAGAQATVSFRPPRVHPSWWPSLPVAVAVGLVIGLAIWLAVRRAGVRLVRAGQSGAAG